MKEGQYALHMLVGLPQLTDEHLINLLQTFKSTLMHIHVQVIPVARQVSGSRRTLLPPEGGASVFLKQILCGLESITIPVKWLMAKLPDGVYPNIISGKHYSCRSCATEYLYTIEINLLSILL